MAAPPAALTPFEIAILQPASGDGGLDGRNVTGSGGTDDGRPLTARIPAGLVVSALGHLAAVGLVAAAFLASREPRPTETAIPVELVQIEPTPNGKPPNDPGASKPGVPAPPSPALPAAAAVLPDKPASGRPAPETPDKPAPPPAAATDEKIEPVTIVPPLPLGAGGPGLADSSNDTTLTKAEIDGFRAEVQRCWDIPAGWTNPRQVSVTIRFRLKRDGTLAGKPAVVEFPASRLGKTAADNALHAVTRCGPYHLPPQKYEQWSDVQLHLAPPAP